MNRLVSLITLALGIAPQALFSQPALPIAPQSIIRPAGTYSTVVLAWNYVPDLSVIAYNVYYGVSTGRYTNMVPVGNTNQATIGRLIPGTTYYFAATSLNLLGLESVYSTEISYAVPGPPPAPTNFIVNVTVQESGDLTNWTSVTNITGLTFTNGTAGPLYWRAVMGITGQ